MMSSQVAFVLAILDRRVAGRSANQTAQRKWAPEGRQCGCPSRQIDISRQNVEPAALTSRCIGMKADVARRVWPEPATTDKGWSQRVGGFTAVPALLRQLGADPIATLEDVGLAPDALDRPEQRIPYATMGALFNEAARRTACPHFGLLCGRAWHLSDLGLVGEIVRNSPTVGSALRKLTVYQHLNSEGGVPFFLQRGGIADLGYAIYAPGVSGASQIYSALMAGGCNFLRELCGTGWAPSEVFFPYAKPADIEPHRHHWRASLRFDSEFCALRFSEHWLDRPVQDADSARLRFAESEADAAGRGELLQQVYRALRVLLLLGRTSGNEVAYMLAMHRRTLNRRLEAQGTTFQHILDRVRYEVARELLADTEMAIDDIAAALGYASISPFVRSFRRWSGTTPGRWRRTGGTGPATGVGGPREL
jgi:AraC-like DNA-binding protein